MTAKINIHRKIIALDRQGTQEQRPELPTVTPPGVQVNTRYIKVKSDSNYRPIELFTQSHMVWSDRTLVEKDAGLAA